MLNGNNIYIYNYEELNKFSVDETKIKAMETKKMLFIVITKIPDFALS